MEASANCIRPVLVVCDTAVTENLAALKKAFPESTVIAYANFMPGCRVPGLATTLLKDVYEFAWANNIGVGGPDLFPYKKEQKSYLLITILRTKLREDSGVIS